MLNDDEMDEDNDADDESGLGQQSRKYTLTERVRAELRRNSILAALLTHATIAAAADAAKVSERTIRRYLGKPRFRALLEEARKAALESAVGSVSSLADDALAALKKNLTCGIPAAEIKAAVAIFDVLLKGHSFLQGIEEIRELQARIDAIERGQDGEGWKLR
jgi:hypothetical protein